MSEKSTEKKADKQTQAKKPVAIKDKEMDRISGGRTEAHPSQLFAHNVQQRDR